MDYFNQFVIRQHVLEIIKFYFYYIMETCEKYEKVPSYIKYAKRIIVIGDLHGDFKTCTDVLLLSKVVDINLNWVGGDTVVVQVGDQIDRCRPINNKCDLEDDEDSDIKILQLFTKLDKQARIYGGYVISLLGNHEIMNIMGNMSYVSNMGIKGFINYKDPKTNKIINDGLEARKHAFSIGNEYGNFLACTRIGILVVGKHIFAHAGILPEFIKKYEIKNINDLYKINDMIKNWLLGYSKSIDQSIFWNRIYGSNFISTSVCDNSKVILNLLKVGKMIIGHTPQNNINNVCTETIWRVDTGMSRAFDSLINKVNRIQVLEILNDNIYNILLKE